MANAKRDKPLAGIRVIDLSRLLPVRFVPRTSPTWAPT